MTDLEASFLAGFFDGEGCVRINTRPSRKGARLNYQAQVVIGNTNREILDWIAKEFGGIVRPRQNSGKQQYFWCVYGAKLDHFLATIFPYSRIKKSEIALTMLFRHSFAGEPGKRLAPGQYERQQELANQIKALKH